MRSREKRNLVSSKDEKKQHRVRVLRRESASAKMRAKCRSWEEDVLHLLVINIIIHFFIDLESYFASGVAGDAFVLAVEFDLVVVQLVFARENGIDDLLAGDILYLSA